MKAVQRSQVNTVYYTNVIFNTEILCFRDIMNGLSDQPNRELTTL